MKVRANGFTLTEMLVSLALISLMAVMMLGGIAMTGRVLAAARTDTAARENVFAVQRVLRERLMQLATVTRSDSSEPRVDANGDETHFTFFAPPPDALQPMELQRYRLMLAPDRTLTLYRASSLNEAVNNENRSMAGWRPDPLLRGVRGIRLSYYGEDRLGSGRRWQTIWETRAQPPDLVRLDLTFDDPAMRWPTLIVRPRATLNTPCEVDQMTGRCRPVE